MEYLSESALIVKLRLNRTYIYAEIIIFLKSYSKVIAFMAYYGELTSSNLKVMNNKPLSVQC